MGLLAFVKRSLMFMNGGLYNSALKLSDSRKLESLNVMGVNGSLTDLIPMWFEPLNELFVRDVRTKCLQAVAPTFTILPVSSPQSFKLR